jgi:hypothetical protein
MCLWSLKKGVRSGSGSINQRHGSGDPQHCLRGLQICRCQAVSTLFLLLRLLFLIPDQYRTRVAVLLPVDNQFSYLNIFSYHIYRSLAVLAGVHHALQVQGQIFGD